MRVTTKYTYIYRIVGVVGCLLVLGSVFMPWVTINAGQIGDFEEGDSPTGWELANLDKGGAWDENIFAYIFMIMYSFLILSPIGIILLLIGKDARSIGYYLTSIAVFFLILVLFLMPLIQESIPIPENPYDSMTQEEIDALDPSTVSKMDEQLAHRERILNMKKIAIGPAMGVMLTVVGGVVTYIGSRLVIADSERIGEMYKYYILLKEAHKGGRITKEEEDLLTAQRKMARITKEEHEMLLHKMFPDERDFKNAVYMHEHPVDMDRLIMEKSLQDYEVFLTQAYSHGEPTKEELQMMEVIRRTLGITMEDHYMVLDYLRAEGKVRKVKRRPSMIRKAPLAEVPEECVVEGETPRYVHSWEYRSTITRETPLDDDSPAAPSGPPPPAARRAGPPAAAGPPSPPPDRAKPVPAAPKEEVIGEPMAAPPTPPPSAPPKAPKEAPKEVVVEKPRPKAKPKRPSKVKCTKCGTTIPVPPSDGPVTITCPKCGISGNI